MHSNYFEFGGNMVEKSFTAEGLCKIIKILKEPNFLILL